MLVSEELVRQNKIINMKFQQTEDKICIVCFLITYIFISGCAHK
jgi:hypothetical protein